MSNPNFKEYHEKAVKKFNEDRKNIYCPHSFEEIREILKYIGGLQRIADKMKKNRKCRLLFQFIMLRNI